jgi:glycosyltransferase involved in cell wall biosynthesis
VVEYLPDPVEADSLPRGDGLAFRHVHGIPQQSPLVLIVGSMGPVPESSTILEVLAEVLALHPRAVIAFVGTDRGDSLKRVLGRRHDRQHRLRVLPPFSRSGPGLRDAVNSADLMVLTPHCADGDRAIVEAWCSLHPVIAPRWGEPGLLVRDGIDGLLYHPRDPAELLLAIGSIFRDPHGASSITRAGFTRILDEFEATSVLRRLCQIYARCIEDYESGPGRLRAW